jgi:hypothetical protein
MTVFWLCVGLGGQACLAARFLVQWIASERCGYSVVPNAFWALSPGWCAPRFSHTPFTGYDPSSSSVNPLA